MVSALNLVLNAHAARSVGGGVEVGRNKFFFPSLTHLRADLGGGLEAWKVSGSRFAISRVGLRDARVTQGFYSSVRPAHQQLMVNVNACTTAVCGFRKVFVERSPDVLVSSISRETWQTRCRISSAPASAPAWVRPCHSIWIKGAVNLCGRRLRQVRTCQGDAPWVQEDREARCKGERPAAPVLLRGVSRGGHR
jgi:hypothetical protein